MKIRRKQISTDFLNQVGMKKFSEYLKTPNAMNESSLSRLYKHMQEHDSGTITAYRSEYTPEQNKKRNYSLMAKISDKRYQITKVDGSYIENFGSDDAVEVKEKVFFVVDAQDKGTLENDLRQWGEEFDQDSIMFIPKGEATGTLIGTSHRENAFPSYGEMKKFEHAVWGKQGQFMTKIRNRPFYFTESSIPEDMVLPEGYFGRMGCNAVAKTHWTKL